MNNQETIKGIREQLKAIKEALTAIEFKLSQLESENQAPSAPAARSEQQQPAKRPPGVEERPVSISQRTPFGKQERRAKVVRRCWPRRSHHKRQCYATGQEAGDREVRQSAQVVALAVRRHWRDGHF